LSVLWEKHLRLINTNPYWQMMAYSTFLRNFAED